MKFDVITGVKMPVLALWVVMMCGLVGRYRSVGTYSLYLQLKMLAVMFLYLPTSTYSVTTQKTNTGICITSYYHIFHRAQN
jgi:hypothetical protein